MHLFYANGKLITQITDHSAKLLLRRGPSTLAIIVEEKAESAILAAAPSGTPVAIQEEKNIAHLAFMPYGENASDTSGSIIGFNGEHRLLNSLYLLGHYRVFHPSLMRFSSADNLSPFDEKAGINSYVFCMNDPVNYADPTGHMRMININGKIMERNSVLKHDFDVLWGSGAIVKSRLPASKPLKRLATPTTNKFLKPLQSSRPARNEKTLETGLLFENTTLYTEAKNRILGSRTLKYPAENLTFKRYQLEVLDLALSHPHWQPLFRNKHKHIGELLSFRVIDETAEFLYDHNAELRAPYRPSSFRT